MFADCCGTDGSDIKFIKVHFRVPMRKLFRLDGIEDLVDSN